MMHLGLGTAAIGRPHYINIKSAANSTEFELEAFKRKGLQLLDAAYQSGIRYFDTAPGYGIAEQLMLDWVTENNPADIEIATKWGYTYTANFDLNAPKHEIKEHSLAKLNEQWEQSKKLLPQLTTYQIHSATFETGVLENLPVLNRLGELKNAHGLKMGITTSGPNQLAVLKKALEVEFEGNALFDVFQVTYNVLEQAIFPVFADARASGKRFVIKEALANGRLFPNESFPHYQPMYHALQHLADKYKVGIDAIALRFGQDSLPSFSVLSGVAEPQHLEENLKVNSFRLNATEIDQLKQFQVPSQQYWQERSLLPWN